MSHKGRNIGIYSSSNPHLRKKKEVQTNHQKKTIESK